MELINRTCSVCNEEFATKYTRQNICSFSCRQIAQRERSREAMRRKRKDTPCVPCVACGYSLTTDTHHEGNKLYTLCPNCHALITRSIMTIDEILTAY